MRPVRMPSSTAANPSVPRDDAVFEPAEIDLVLRLEITPLRGGLCVPDKLGIGFIGAEMQLVHDRFPREVVVLGTIGRPR